MAPSAIFSTPSRSRMNNAELQATANGSAMAPAGPDGTSGAKEYTISVPGTVASKLTAVGSGAHGALTGSGAGPTPGAPRAGLDKDPVSPTTPAAATTPPLPSSAIATNGAGKTAFEGAPAFSVPGTPTQDSRPEIRMEAVSSKPSNKVVLQEALKSLTETGRETFQSTLETVKTLRAKKPINVTLDQLVQGLFFTVLGFQLLLIKIFRPSPWHLMMFTMIGFAFGLGCSFMYFANKRRKAEACEVLGMNVGLKGLQHLVGTLPSWLSYTEHEKVAWLNKTLLEVWPFYDKGVCKMVKKQTETIFQQALKTMKVPGIKSIGFKQLTFGDAPFRVETIHVNDKQHDAMEMELDVRWCGEANITLAIELIAGEFAKMCPRVTDITFVGSLRIVLKPLVDQIPGFGAALVTFRKPPRLKYRLDFGNALGGKYAATVVKPFINHVINNIIVNMLVWPQRLVVPVINSEEMQVEIQKMAYHNQGMLKVTLVQATGLKKADLMGSSDPMVEVTTDGKKTVATKTMRNTLTPRWDETFWLLVQEPTAQEMKVTVNDKDFFSAGNLLSTNPTSAFGAKELLGRCSVKLAPITAQEPEPVTKWYHLGEGDWTNSEGCGKGCGRIQITALYRGFNSFKADELSTAELGVLMIRVQHASKLPRSAGSKGAMTAYVRVKCGEQVEETPPVTSKADHKFTNRNVFDFYDVKYSADVKIKVFEATMGADDEIGDVEIGVSDIAGAKDVNPLSGKQENGLLLRTFNLENSGGASIVVELRYAPYF